MKPKTVDEYINNFPEDQKSKLSELREIIRATLPDTHEQLKWGSPATIDKAGNVLLDEQLGR
ncbi:MAG TPA: hypothetical protein VD947_04490 [Patescibacteria group bacterium]|nr:hypothetical protein [Patescibacteria group bacterium]